jgi:hypothetical protein
LISWRDITLHAISLLPAAVAISHRAAGVLGYPSSEGLPIIPKQRNPGEPAIAGRLDYQEWRWPFARSKTDLYFQELFIRQPGCA